MSSFLMPLIGLLLMTWAGYKIGTDALNRALKSTGKRRVMLMVLSYHIYIGGALCGVLALTIVQIWWRYS